MTDEDWRRNRHKANRARRHHVKSWWQQLDVLKRCLEPANLAVGIIGGMVPLMIAIAGYIHSYLMPVEAKPVKTDLRVAFAPLEDVSVIPIVPDSDFNLSVKQKAVPQAVEPPSGSRPSFEDIRRQSDNSQYKVDHLAPRATKNAKVASAPRPLTIHPSLKAGDHIFLRASESRYLSASLGNTTVFHMNIGVIEISKFGNPYIREGSDGTVRMGEDFSVFANASREFSAYASEDVDIEVVEVMIGDRTRKG